jgi:hypothetical protein
MSRNRSLVVVIVATAMSVAGLLTKAYGTVTAVSGVTISGEDYGGGSIGMEFIPNVDISVSALGRWYISAANDNIYAHGGPLNGTRTPGTIHPHRLELSQVLPGYTPGNIETGTATVIAAVTMDPLTTTVSGDGFQYAPIAPVLLLAGQRYLVAAYDTVGAGYSTADPYSQFGSNSFTMSPYISFVGADGGSATGGVGTTGNYASYTYIANSSYGPVNLAFEAPEPASIGVLALASLGLLRRSGRRRAA